MKANIVYTIRIMRKYFLSFAIAGAAAMMCSCAKEPGSCSQDSGDAIEFGTYMGRDAQTRSDDSSVMNIDKLKETGFGVSAFYSGQDDWHLLENDTPNFMRSQKISWENGAWTYSPVKYWPTMTGDKLTFFAYAPYAGEAGENGFYRSDAFTSQHYTLKFKIQDKADEMVDFVAAEIYNMTRNENSNDNNLVTFEFHHTLSRLAFKARTSEDLDKDSHVVIRNAHLVKGGYFKQSTYYFHKKDEHINSWGPIDSKGDKEKDKLTEDYPLLPILNTVTGTTIGGKPYNKDEQGNTINVLEISSKDAKSIFKEGKYLFLIPEVAERETGKFGIAANSSAVSFEYDIVTRDSRLAAGYSCTSAVKTVYLPEGILDQGKAYVVTFTFNVDRIEVSAKAEEWKDTEESEIDVPFTPDNASSGK